MTKKLAFKKDARATIINGAKILYDAVSVTLGPNGRNVILERGLIPHVTKDGVTVAAEINVKDKMANVGVQIIKHAAIQTAIKAGDGTTSATILAYSMMKHCEKLVNDGANPVEVKKGIELGVKDAIAHFNAIKKPIESPDEIKSVASISANNDEVVGTLIAEAMSKIKDFGMITVEDSKTVETSVEVVEGLQIKRGLYSPYFVNNIEKMQAELDKPYILLYDNKIADMAELIPILEKVRNTSRPLLIVAESVDGPALSFLIQNHVKNMINVCLIKSPGFGLNKMDQLDDMACVTGAQVISADRGLNIKTVTLDDLGEAEKIIVTYDTTIIMNGSGEREQVKERIAKLKEQIKAVSEIEKAHIGDRLARLDGGIAVIKVGAVSEIELKEKKDRIDDSISAAKAAREDGIVAGGGIAYLRASQNMEFDSVDENAPKLTDDARKGYNVVKKALTKPLKTILRNSGAETNEIYDNVCGNSGNYGYNAKTEKYGDMLEQGVLDPVKVCKVALENAASVASMYLITECVIVNDDEEQKQK